MGALIVSAATACLARTTAACVWVRSACATVDSARDMPPMPLSRESMACWAW